MATAPFGSLIQQMRNLAAIQCPWNDGQLLQRFTGSCDEFAFTAIVARHGPMVLRVCRNVLQHEQDAEDAFQAAFLVLAKNTKAIRKPEALADWLHGVAYRTAMKAKRSAARRRNHETRLGAMPSKTATSPAWDDVQAVLDEEIQRLTAPFRSVFVLCVLEGKSRPEAAAALGIEEGTVGSRLMRAREQLQKRLERRGIQLALLMAALSASKSVLQGGVPAQLADATIRSGIAIASGAATAGILPAHIAALAAGVSRAMFLTKVKTATVLLLTAGLFAGVVAANGHGLGGANDQVATGQKSPDQGVAQQVSPKALPEAKATPQSPEAKAPSPNAKSDAKKAIPPAGAVVLKGRITNERGEPIPGAFVAVVAANKTSGAVIAANKTNIQVVAEGVADAGGRYELTLTGVSSKSHAEAGLYARADKMAMAAQEIDLKRVSAPLDVKLRPEQPIQVRLIDLEGKPAANVPAESSDELGPRLRNVMPHAISDADGLLTIPGFAANQPVYFTIAGSEKFARQSLRFNTGQPEVRAKNDGTFRGLVKNVPPGQVVTIPLAPAKFFEGVVLLGESDKPAANARITIWAGEQRFPNGSMVSIEGKTDARGRFRLNPYAGIQFGINAYPPEETAFFAVRGEPLEWDVVRSKNLEIRLPAAVLASGTVIDSLSGKPIAGAFVQYMQNANNNSTPENALTGWQAIQHTDAQGRFKITVPPGPGTLLVHSPAGANYVLQEKGSQEVYYDKSGGQRYYAHAFQRISPPVPNAKAGSTEPFIVEPIPLKAGAQVAIKLVDSDGKSIDQALYLSRLKVSPTSPQWWGSTSTTEANGGAVEISGLDKGKQYPVYFLDPKRRLGATALISTDHPQMVVTLKPCASAKVRFLEADGKPASGWTGVLQMVVTPGRVGYSLKKPAELVADADFISNIDRVNYGRDYAADKDGVLHSPVLIPGATYRFINIGDDGERVAEKEFVAESGKMHDLGDIKLRNKQ